MRLIDWLQWLFLAAISAGFFLISVRSGLIATETLGIAGTTAMEFLEARRESRQKGQKG